MCGNGFHCSLPFCPICGGVSAKSRLDRGEIPMMNYKYRDQDIQRLINRNLTSIPGPDHVSSREEKECTCGSGYSMLCPKHGIGKY